jgi:DNA repair protein RadC
MANQSKGISVWPQEDRPRERLLSRGPEALTDTELIAILIRVGLALMLYPNLFEADTGREI